METAELGSSSREQKGKQLSSSLLCGFGIIVNDPAILPIRS